MRQHRSKKGLWAILIVIFILLLAAAILGGRYMFRHSRIVGTDIDFTEVTEFYYTRTASTYPPSYQRYHFSVADGSYRFYHETREGGTFPLTEEDITVSGSIELSADQWEAFLSHLSGGSIRRRSESIEGSGKGPSLYLYWQGDRGRYQSYNFPSPADTAAFEAFCEQLRDLK